MSMNRQSRPRGRGRPEGARERTTKSAKEAILEAFELLGGVKRLVEWVKEDKKNEFVFYAKIYPMLVPRPAPEPPPEKAELPPVRGALIWEPPTPSPYPPLSSSPAAEVSGETREGRGRPASTDDPAEIASSASAEPPA